MEFNEGQESAGLVHFNKNGKSKISSLNSQMGQAINIENETGLNYLLGIEDLEKGKKILKNDKNEIVWSAP